MAKTQRTPVDLSAIIAGKNPAYRQFGFVEMLTPDGYNPKTKKGRARGYSTAILHLAPAALSGVEMCHYRTKGCSAACLNTAGHGGIKLDAQGLNDVQRARIARTHLLIAHPEVFMAMLWKAIATHIRRATRKGLIPVVRLNGTSDVAWENLTGPDGLSVFAAFSGIQFYDYTKNPGRAIQSALGALPANYVLTFSRAETTANQRAADAMLLHGGNVAVVMTICGCKRACKHEIPDGLTYLGRRVVNGDHDDLRFLDPAGVVVGLKGKGRAKQDKSGFVVDMRDAIAALGTVELARAA